MVGGRRHRGSGHGGWPDSSLSLLSTSLHPQPPAGSAVAVALSTSCPLRAAVCVMKNVTTIGGGSAGIEVRSRLGPLPSDRLKPFLVSLCCTL